jgi:hypothetical protein
MTRLLSVVLAFGIGMATVAAAHEAQAQVVYSTYYAPAPVTSFYAPATTAYYAPATTAYYAPPVTSYYAPETTAYYAAPVTSYYAPVPVTAYYAPPVTSYYAPAPYTAYYGPSVGVGVVAGPVVVRSRVYVRGEPVRNFFRAF